MDNWNPTVVYQMAIDRHNQDMANGEASRRLASLAGAQPTRHRLASILLGLAARLGRGTGQSAASERGSTTTA